MPASALAGLSLLVLGESHMSLADHLVEPLNAALVQEGAKVHSIGACGASAADWLTTKKVDCGAEQRDNGKLVIKGRDATTTPIKELIVQLDPHQFVQVHRSVVVNLRSISHVRRHDNDTAEIHLKGRKETLPVSRNYLHVFRQM